MSRPGVSPWMAADASSSSDHGGDPNAIAFCQRAGLDDVSCSAYRVLAARLAAAQAALWVPSPGTNKPPDAAPTP